MFITISIFGILFSLSQKNKILTFFGIAGGVLLLISFIGIITNIYSLPDRWWYYSEQILPIITV